MAVDPLLIFKPGVLYVPAILILLISRIYIYYISYYLLVTLTLWIWRIINNFSKEELR